MSPRNNVHLFRGNSLIEVSMMLVMATYFSLKPGEIQRLRSVDNAATYLTAGPTPPNNTFADARYAPVKMARHKMR